MEDKYRENIANRYYDFMDLGSASGGSIDYCMRRFDTRRGLGVDRDPAEVGRIRAADFHAIQADILEFECPPHSFRFVTMMDFLEHLPGLDAVEKVLSRVRKEARDFLFIRHPSFDHEPYLNAVGLKQYWTDWPDLHTAKLTVADFTGIFQRLGLNTYSICYRHPVHDSSDPTILPLSAPADQHDYDAEKHGEKPRIAFSHPVFSQIDFFVALREFDPDEWAKICAPWDK